MGASGCVTGASCFAAQPYTANNNAAASTNIALLFMPAPFLRYIG